MSFDPGGDDGGPIAAINVTPLVDVMLVLLVIFMVTAPMLQQGVDVNLPKATTAPMSGGAEQLVVSINKDGEVFLGSGNPMKIDELTVKLTAVLTARKEEDRKIYIKGDQDLNYGKIMEVMGKLYDAGIYQIGLVSAPIDSGGKK